MIYIGIFFSFFNRTFLKGFPFFILVFYLKNSFIFHKSSLYFYFLSEQKKPNGLVIICGRHWFAAQIPARQVEPVKIRVTLLWQRSCLSGIMSMESVGPCCLPDPFVWFLESMWRIHNNAKRDGEGGMVVGHSDRCGFLFTLWSRTSDARRQAEALLDCNAFFFNATFLYSIVASRM